MRKLEARRLLVATHNAGKAAEMAALFAPYGIEVISAAERGLPSPEETGTTFAENARIKAHAAARATGEVALSDDSGLEVDGLGGDPGVRTADWAEGPGGRDFGRAMARVHDALREAGATEPWRARFRATLVLAWPDGHDEVVDGTAEGRIVWPPRGEAGHGYDPIFEPEGSERTFAEMSEAEKNDISHRANAFAKLIASCLA